ncbi:1-deoxy-D-xylulose-5-phosphate reductoisomerase [Tolumonas lignilytica]|jgi:1-deoxy-D-xylulose 5-phosphate reductoisomerase|uniref:1-deoxy-D-xylulose-5-phosphate reductoisomerase n=1 Tax=Tolumonas lignilytica TaxID=1283284 RepID=UPI00046381DB|nr:1-deoxy-D-xylulose-5-phosphate reductoisomerase [Tolumonas lignilytica]
MQYMTILGSTGSIGRSTLDIVRRHRDKFTVTALTANSDVEQMIADCLEFQPSFAVMADEKSALVLREALASHKLKTEVLAGVDALCLVASYPSVDVVMAAIVGAAGLLPALAAIKKGKTVLLANKEALVMSGRLFIETAQQSGAKILPVDSEHNAIFQCLPADAQATLGFCDLHSVGVEKILLTGSGGPFRYTPVSELNSVTPEQAVAHPNWSMGRKISVDSASMMNKGLEFIEAKWLFNAQPDQIQVIIHPQSVIHSMVQYRDGSVLAQMGQPDMRTPIAHAMGFPERVTSGVNPLDFSRLGELSFLPVDFDRYPCLKLAIEACWAGQSATTALNAANEVAVEAFLNTRIGFTQIHHVVADVLSALNLDPANELETILAIDTEARHLAHQKIMELTA